MSSYFRYLSAEPLAYSAGSEVTVQPGRLWQTYFWRTLTVHPPWMYSSFHDKYSEEAQEAGKEAKWSCPDGGYESKTFVLSVPCMCISRLSHKDDFPSGNSLFTFLLFSSKWPHISLQVFMCIVAKMNNHILWWWINHISQRFSNVKIAHLLFYNINCNWIFWFVGQRKQSELSAFFKIIFWHLPNDLTRRISYRLRERNHTWICKAKDCNVLIWFLRVIWHIISSRVRNEENI